MDIQWNQPSTIRGSVWLVAGLISTVCVFTDNLAAVAIIMAAAQTIVGGLGVAISDNRKE